MKNEIETVNAETGEIETVGQQSLAVSLSRAEIDQQLTTALAYPRDARKGGMRGIVNRINSLATLSDEAAAECVYALPRGGKPIRGASVRLAEIVAGQWGNCRVGARVVHVDRFEKYVEAEGIFHDLETNTATTARVRRRIVDSKGRIYTDDMILVTGNAAASIAKRNAIFGGVPKAIWNESYKAADAVIAGDIKTLVERRDSAIKAFAVWGIKPEQVFASLDVTGMEDIDLDKIATLVAMYRAIKDGDQKPEDYFTSKIEGASATAAKGTAAKLNKLVQDAAPQKETSAAVTPITAADGGSAVSPARDADPQPIPENTEPAVVEPTAKPTGDDAFRAGQAHGEQGLSLRGMPLIYRDDKFLSSCFTDGYQEVVRHVEGEGV